MSDRMSECFIQQHTCTPVAVRAAAVRTWLESHLYIAMPFGN